MKRPFPKPAADAPPGTVWFGGPISWFSISLIIRADDLVPDDVTRLLLVEPTSSQTKGLPTLHTVRPGIAKFGSWKVQLRSEETDEWDVTEAVRTLIARFPQAPSVWKQLPEGARVRLSFGLSLESRNQGFSVPADILQFAADRNIDLDFDVYSA
ncbi:DUF4279 domain-containing protein [Bradyrhizobium diazoefficiens]|nr:DUF4279 domain-containing protein [Bradyrhizobium diazoefficiens]MBR0848507.1 DUF4279 domain-containing protein [Bradyrhizobium diazoefficiens]